MKVVTSTALTLNMQRSSSTGGTFPCNVQSVVHCLQMNRTLSSTLVLQSSWHTYLENQQCTMCFTHMCKHRVTQNCSVSKVMV